MAMIIKGVAYAQHIPAPFEWTGEYALIFYNSIFGTLNDYHIFEGLAIGSLFYLAFYYLYATRRKTPIKTMKFVWWMAFKSTAGYLSDIMFTISAFLSASLNLLDVLANAPESISMGVQMYGIGMLICTLFYVRIKQKLHLQVQDPTNMPFDPLLVGKKLSDYLILTKEPRLISCLTTGKIRS